MMRVFLVNLDLSTDRLSFMRRLATNVRKPGFWRLATAQTPRSMSAVEIAEDLIGKGRVW
jgi:hypothetical protein